MDEFLLIGRKHPDSLPMEGSGAAAHLEIPYVPKYDEFNEIRKIQSAQHRADPFRSETVILYLNLTEWLGHTADRYFKVLMMFLADKRKEMRYVFLCDQAEEKMLKDMYLTMRCYMHGSWLIDRQLETIQGLAGELAEEGLSTDAAKETAAILMGRSFEEFRTYEFLHQLANDMKYVCHTDKVEKKHLKRYIREENNLLALIDSKVGKEKTHE